jgi:hypothetical protein
MSMTDEERTPSEQKPLPIFTSVGERSSKRVATAILALMLAGVVAVVAIVVANAVG